MHGLRALAIWIITAFILFVALLMVGDKVVTTQSASRIVDVSHITTPDGIVVLGAGVSADGKVSSMLAERLDKTVELHNFYLHVPIVVSGDGSASHNNEPAHMKKYLVNKGVPEALIIEDDQGINTGATVDRAIKMYRLEHPIYVSQEYHLYRTLYISGCYGKEAWGVACDQQTFHGQTKRDVREVLARLKDLVIYSTMKVQNDRSTR